MTLPADARRSDANFTSTTIHRRAMRCRLSPRWRDLNRCPPLKKNKSSFELAWISEEPRSNSLRSTRMAKRCTGIASPRRGSTITEAVAGIEKRLERCATVGIGIPGTISRKTGLVKNANSTWLNGKPFDTDLSRALGREVRCANDANCLAVSEATDGAGAGKHIVFAVILGTGCGGGIAVDGRVHSGSNGVAGEWGHNTLPWMRPEEFPGPACYCGRNGCVETWISGTGLEADYERATSVALKGPEIIARSGAGAIRRPAHARLGASDQSPRSGCNCTGRGRLTNSTALSKCSRTLEGLRFRQRRGHADSSSETRRRQRRARRRLALESVDGSNGATAMQIFQYTTA